MCLSTNFFALECNIIWCPVLMSELNVASSHGLTGHRTTSNQEQFKRPLVVAYYDVDYVKNTKGTNYWRNR